MTERVALMVTCVVDVFRPAVAEAAVRALEGSGRSVEVPADQTCCGQPAWNAGYPDEARSVARNALRAFAGDRRVVCLAGSCATMIRVFYRELFAGRPEEAAAVDLASRTVEFSELLAGGAREAPVSGAVAYHDSCHMLRELGLRDQPRSLLRAAGVDCRDVSERCCGFGGTFSVKLPAVSAAMADEKLAEFSATGEDTVVGCDLSCLLHLEGRARATGVALRFRHLAEVLA